MRDPKVQSFLDAAERAIRARAGDLPAADAAADRVFAALRTRQGEGQAAATAELPAHRCFARALALSDGASPPVRDLGRAIAALSPELPWTRRPGAEGVGETFWNGHANAYVVGPAGIERRDDVLVGMSLMVPDLDYPVHRHPPEEVYVSLAGGEWWKRGSPWVAPGQGGLVYNEPGVDHAMRTGAEPLLAVWCLWSG